VYAPFAPEARTTVDAAAGESALNRQAQRFQVRQRQLRAQLARLAPRGFYVVIDQTHNRLYVRKDNTVVLQAVCSAGSGMVLKEGATGRTWVFDTPRGRFQVLSRTERPVWRKPDWAFVEEGQPIPTNAAERFEYGTLGEYALYFGNGYMIHGTLYERLLGRSVTHGCIRLGREDLRKVWAKVPIGTPIFIY
jgi:L,D-transpeptidase YbiS